MGIDRGLFLFWSVFLTLLLKKGLLDSIYMPASNKSIAFAA